MRQNERLRRAADFAAVWSEGRSQADRLLVIKARPNGLAHSRFGFSVSKRVGNAVVRNRVKRRLREAARSVSADAGFDVVIAARTSAAKADYWQCRRSVLKLMRRAGALGQDRGRRA